MTNTNKAASGEQNLDHLGAILEKAKSDARHMITIQPAAVLELIALARRAAPAGLSTALAEVTAKLEREAAANLSLGMENRQLREELASRAAPVSAPIAGDVQFIKTWQMRAAEAHGMRWQSAWNLEQHMYAEIADLRAALANLRKQVDAALERELAHYAATTERQLAELDALANQPAPTAAPEQVAQGADEHALFEAWYIASQAENAGRTLREDEVEIFLQRRDDSAGTYIVCNPQWTGWQARAALSQPSEAAPLPPFTVSRYSDTKQRGVLVIFDRKLLDSELDTVRAALAAPSLPAAFVPFGRFHSRTHPDGSTTTFHTRDDDPDSFVLYRAAHQPAQEQAEPLSEAQLDRIARSYFSEQWAVAHAKDAIHDAFMEAAKVAASPVVRAQSEESGPREFEIWAEGYCDNGTEGRWTDPVLWGRADGVDFLDACRNFAKENEEFARYLHISDGVAHAYTRLHPQSPKLGRAAIRAAQEGESNE